MESRETDRVGMEYILMDLDNLGNGLAGDVEAMLYQAWGLRGWRAMCCCFKAGYRKSCSFGNILRPVVIQWRYTRVRQVELESFLSIARVDRPSFFKLHQAFGWLAGVG